MTEIPYGYCHCGCGQKTKLATRNRKSLGWVKGEPLTFINSHCPKPIRYKSLSDRLWSKVDKSGGDSSCWNWTGYLTPSGQGGRMAIGGRKGSHIYPHRVAYILTFGEIPEGLYVCHKCDNPACCNPSHLFLGTHQDNMRDRDTKGRQSNSNLNGERKSPHKLTLKEVEAIRDRFIAGGISKAELARQNNVSAVTVRRIVSGASWRVNEQGK